MYPYMPKPKLEKKIQVPTEVIPKLLTQSELRMLKNRWEIVNLLEDGLSIRNIAKQVRVGTDTVVRVSRMVEKGDLRKMINRPKLDKLPFKTNTPWIFGKGN